MSSRSNMSVMETIGESGPGGMPGVGELLVNETQVASRFFHASGDDRDRVRQPGQDLGASAALVTPDERDFVDPANPDHIAAVNQLADLGYNRYRYDHLRHMHGIDTEEAAANVRLAKNVLADVNRSFYDADAEYSALQAQLLAGTAVPGGAARLDELGWRVAQLREGQVAALKLVADVNYAIWTRGIPRPLEPRGPSGGDRPQLPYQQEMRNIEENGSVAIVNGHFVHYESVFRGRLHRDRMPGVAHAPWELIVLQDRDTIGLRRPHPHEYSFVLYDGHCMLHEAHSKPGTEVVRTYSAASGGPIDHVWFRSVDGIGVWDLTFQPEEGTGLMHEWRGPFGQAVCFDTAWLIRDEVFNEVHQERLERIRATNRERVYNAVRASTSATSEHVNVA